MFATTSSFRRGGLFAFLALAALTLAPPAAGAQELRLRGLTGGELSEADLSQGAVVIVVWASWSPRSQDIVERVNAIANRWSGKARVLTVNFQEDAATVQRFLAGKNLRVPVFLDQDGGFSKRYAVTTLPSLLAFRDGRAGFRGKLPEDPSKVLSEVLE